MLWCASLPHLIEQCSNTDHHNPLYGWGQGLMKSDSLSWQQKRQKGSLHTWQERSTCYIRSDIFYLFNEPKFKFTIQKTIMTFSQTVSANSTIDKFLLSKLVIDEEAIGNDWWGAYSVLLTVELLLIITSSLVNILLCDAEATKIDLTDTLN